MNSWFTPWEKEENEKAIKDLFLTPVSFLFGNKMDWGEEEY